VSHTIQHEKSDWEAIPPPSRTSGQRLAARTHGYITPGNLITMCGVLLSFGGLALLYNHRFGWGLLLLGLGRLADIIDGLIADRTKTKSRVGEALDAGFDKVVAVATIMVFLIKDLVPVWPLVIILAISLCNVGLGAIAKLRHRIIHPTQAGKYAALLQWASLLLFVLAKVVMDQSVFVIDLCIALGYIVFMLSMLPAIDAMLGYMNDAFGRRRWHDVDVRTGLSGRFLRTWHRFIGKGEK
jgi:phosphatidylglycerophosphate synthase